MPTVSVPPLPSVLGYEPTASEAVPAEEGLVDVLATPALAVMLDS